MHLQEQKMYHFSLIALDCGLGKTLTTLVFIISSTKERLKTNALYPEDAKEFRATLVVCPAGAIDVWYQDIEKFFPSKPVKIYQFYGTPKTVPGSRLSNLITTVDELNSLLDGLDPTDPQVSLSYQYDKSSIVDLS
jgi:SNF2 family DNA or RNA helicase